MLQGVEGILAFDSKGDPSLAAQIGPYADPFGILAVDSKGGLESTAQYGPHADPFG